MTGITQVLIAARGQGTVQAVSGDFGKTSHTTGLLTTSITINTDGTYTQDIGSGGNWFFPTQVGIGSSWSVRFTIVTQSQTTTGGVTFGTWLALTSARTPTFTNDTTAHEGTGTLTVAFSSDGGSTIAVTSNIQWDVGYIGP